MKSIILSTLLFTSFATLSLTAVAPFFPPLFCPVAVCPAGTICIETESGPQCSPSPPLTVAPLCSTTICPPGQTCVETSGLAECVSIEVTPTPEPSAVSTPPPTSCLELVCAANEFCTDTPGGGVECTPDVGCAATTCVEGSGCVVTPTGPRCVPVDPTPTPTPSDFVCLCPAVIDPVCCLLDSGELRTANNECECVGDACDAGRIFSEGECPPTSCDELDCDSNCNVIDGVAQCVSDPIASCACAATFDPVCCQTPSGLQTKANACLCGCEPSSRILKKGQCSSTLPPTLPPPPPDGCLCFALFDPVCCQSTSGAVSQASNSCECECSGGTVIESGCDAFE